jgi:hypothetical protein
MSSNDDFSSREKVSLKRYRESDEVYLRVRDYRNGIKRITIELTLEEAKDLARRLEKLAVMRCKTCRKNIEGEQYRGQCLRCYTSFDGEINRTD